MSQNEFSSARQNLVPETKKRKRVALPFDPWLSLHLLTEITLGVAWHAPTFFLLPPLFFVHPWFTLPVCQIRQSSFSFWRRRNNVRPRASARHALRIEFKCAARDIPSFAREEDPSPRVCVRAYTEASTTWSREREFPTSERIRSCTTADKVPVEVLMDSTNLSRFPSRRLIKVGNCRSRFETDTSIFSLSLL